MNWKAKQRHLAEMCWKKRGHKEIMIPPPPQPMKIMKICNPHRPDKGFAQVVMEQFFPKAVKTVGLGPMIEAQDRWGEQISVPKVSPFLCPFNFINKLEKRGYKVLGRGAYSTVLGKEGSERVIKVSRSLDDWIDYVQWGAKNGYAGNFVPRVYSWKRHSNLTLDWNGYPRDWSVAIVERMAETVHDNKLDLSLLYNLYYPANSGNVMAQVYMEDLCPGSFKFFKELSENKFSSDIAGKNMMIRKDGSFCVTDPTCGNIKTDKKRLRSGELSPSVLRITNVYDTITSQLRMAA